GTFGTLRWDAYALDGERGVPGSEEFPTPDARLVDRRRALAGRWSSPAAQPWRGALDVSWWSSTRRYRDDDAAFGPVREQHESDRVRAEVSMERIADRFAVRWMGGASLDELRSTTDGRRSRNTFDSGARASLDGTWGARPVRAMLALRVDGVEGFDPAWSPRIGFLATAIPGRLTVRGSAGLSHRTPSFDELFWPPRASAAGNPDLAPERGRDLDAGLALDRLPLGGHVAVDAFRRDVDDLIQWIPGAGGVWRPHNVGAARIVGWEASAGCAVSLGGAGRLRVDASATRLRSEDRSGEPNVDGRELVYRPPWVADVTTAWEEPTGGELSGELRVVDAVYVTRANTKSLPGYATVDVRYRRPLGRGLALDAALTNATDRTARDFRDYPLPGRAFELGLAYRRDAS
ncbi:TonB-dependent receptor, partial [bacterium]|nr:TonB-dependent receptor [bacterium]